MNPRLLRWLPPVLLLAVASNQHRLVMRDGLTPWCGGGFGMFSTADGRFARHLHVYATSAGVQTELAIPAALEERAQAVAALPSRARLDALARDLAPFAESDFEPPDSIRVDVFTVRFDQTTLAPSGVLLRSRELPVARP